MTAVTDLAQRAYGAGSPGAATPRETEYRAFAYVTGLLTAARDSGAFPRTADAIHQNLRLWLALATDLAAPDNKLPQPLRAQLLGLASFSERHGRRALEGAETVDALIDVNTAIMKGLRGEREAAA